MYSELAYWLCGCSFFCLIGCFSMIVWTPTVFERLVCIRDVNLPLFGGIPGVFFTFRFFKNHFPPFFKWPTKTKQQKQNKTKKAGLRRRHCWESSTVGRVQRACHRRESSKSFGTRVLAFSVSGRSPKARYLHSAIEI